MGQYEESIAHILKYSSEVWLPPDILRPSMFESGSEQFLNSVAATEFSVSLALTGKVFKQI